MSLDADGVQALENAESITGVRAKFLAFEPLTEKNVFVAIPAEFGEFPTMRMSGLHVSTVESSVVIDEVSYTVYRVFESMTADDLEIQVP